MMHQRRRTPVVGLRGHAANGGGIGGARANLRGAFAVLRRSRAAQLALLIALLTLAGTFAAYSRSHYRHQQRGPDVATVGEKVVATDVANVAENIGDKRKSEDAAPPPIRQAGGGAWGPAPLRLADLSADSIEAIAGLSPWHDHHHRRAAADHIATVSGGAKGKLAKGKGEGNSAGAAAAVVDVAGDLSLDEAVMGKLVANMRRLAELERRLVLAEGSYPPSSNPNAYASSPSSSLLYSPLPSELLQEATASGSSSSGGSSVSAGVSLVDVQLFAVWPGAMKVLDRIVRDVASRFVILDIVKMDWSSATTSAAGDILVASSPLSKAEQFYYFEENLWRLYSGKGGLRRATMKLKVSQCGGAGPFVVIVVADPSPQYTDEETAHGTDRVNKNMFNAKRLYRRWSGEGGFRVHGTYSAIEAEHDVRVLLGVRPFALAAERLLVGSDSSAEELSSQSKRKQNAKDNYYSSGTRGGVRGLAGRFLAEMAAGGNGDGNGSSFLTRRGTIAFPSSASYFNAFQQQSPAAADSESDEAAGLPPQAKGGKHSKKKKKDDKKAKGGEGLSIKETKGGALAVADGLLLYSARRSPSKEKEQRQVEEGNAAADASSLGLSVELMRWPSCSALWFALSAAASTVTQATDASITPLLRAPPFASDAGSSSRPPAPAMALAFATNAGSAISSSSSSSSPSHVVFDWRAEDRRRLLRNGAGMAGEGGGLSPAFSSFYLSASVVRGGEEGNSAAKNGAVVASMAAADCAAYTSYYYLPRHRQDQHSARSSSSSKSVAGVSVLRPIFVTTAATTGINREKKGGGFSSTTVDFFDGGALRECLDEERSVLAGGGDAFLVGDTPKSRGAKESAEGVRLRAAAFSMPMTMKPNAPAQTAAAVRGVAWLASLEIRAPSSSQHQHQPSAAATVKDMLAAVYTVVSATYGTVLMPHVRAAVLRGASSASDPSSSSEETDPSLSAAVLTYALHLEALASDGAASSTKTLTAVRKLLLQASTERGEGVSYLPERMRLLSRVASRKCNEARVDALLAPRFSPSALLEMTADGGGLFPAETAEELKSAFPHFFSGAAASSDSLSATALLAGDRSALQTRLEEELKRVVAAEGVNAPPKKKGFDNKHESYQQGEEALPSEGGNSAPSPLLPPFLDRPDLFLLGEGGIESGAEADESSNGILCAAGRGVAVMTVVIVEGIGRVFMDVCARL